MSLLRERVARRGIGAIEPCLPSPAKAPPSGPGWIHEIKHDGLRIVARGDGARVRLITRAGNDFSWRFPRIAEAVAQLPVQSCIGDGEAIVCDENGLADFELIRHQRTGADALLCAFDLVELDGKDLRLLPIEERKARRPVAALGEGQEPQGARCYAGGRGLGLTLGNRTNCAFIRASLSCRRRRNAPVPRIGTYPLRFRYKIDLELSPAIVGPSITRNSGIIGEGVDAPEHVIICWYRGWLQYPSS